MLRAMFIHFFVSTCGWLGLGLNHSFIKHLWDPEDKCGHSPWRPGSRGHRTCPCWTAPCLSWQRGSHAPHRGLVTREHYREQFQSQTLKEMIKSWKLANKKVTHYSNNFNLLKNMQPEIPGHPATAAEGPDGGCLGGATAVWVTIRRCFSTFSPINPWPHIPLCICTHPKWRIRVSCFPLGLCLMTMVGVPPMLSQTTPAPQNLGLVLPSACPTSSCKNHFKRHPHW